MSTAREFEEVNELRDYLTHVGARAVVQGGDKESVNEAVTNAYTEKMTEAQLELPSEFATALIDSCVRRAIADTGGISISTNPVSEHNG